MASSLIDGNSILAIDVGAANTRAVFFDVVEGEYRFVASGVAPSTAEAPYKDVSEGVRNAIQNLQSVLGRSLLDGSRNLITPSQPNGSGVDALVATLSAGPTIKTVLVGLLKDVSLESARRLAESTYMRIVETLNISDRRKPDQQIDAVLRARPDLIVIAGGTDGGASRSIQKLLEPIGLASFTMPLIDHISNRLEVAHGRGDVGGQVDRHGGDACELSVAEHVHLAVDLLAANDDLHGLFAVVALELENLGGVAAGHAAFINTDRARLAAGHEELKAHGAR